MVASAGPNILGAPEQNRERPPARTPGPSAAPRPSPATGDKTAPSRVIGDLLQEARTLTSSKSNEFRNITSVYSSQPDLFQEVFEARGFDEDTNAGQASPTAPELEAPFLLRPEPENIDTERERGIAAYEAALTLGRSLGDDLVLADPARARIPSSI